MNEETLHFLQDSYHNTDKDERVKALVEKQTEIMALLDEILSENGQVGFTFTALLNHYEELGYSFEDLLIDMLDAGEGQKEGDWGFEDTIVIGALEMGGPVDLS